MVATDRDVLAVEPNVFRDIAWAGQRLVSGSGSTIGGVLTQTPGLYDVSFVDADVGTGHVVVHAGVALEVVARIGATSVTVSRIRASTSDPVIPVADTGASQTVVYTLAPQIRMVTDQVYRLLGVAATGSALGPNQLVPEHVYDIGDIRRAVVMGTLHMAYSASAALSSEGSPLHQRTELYRRMFALERERAVVRFDADGDGEPEFTRRMNIMRFERL